MSTFRPVRIGDLGRVVTGRTPPSASPWAFDGDVPFLTPTDIDGESRFLTTTRTVSATWDSQQKRVSLPPRAICTVCIGATIGKICMTAIRSQSNQQINSVIVDEEQFDPFFVYYKLSTLRDTLRQRATGAATPIINKTAFSDIILEMPSRQDQRRIASTLSAYDDLIELNQRRAAILEEMARRLFDEWFVHLRFPGHEGMACTDSLLGKIPQGWEIQNVERLVRRLSVGEKYDQKTVRAVGATPVFDQSRNGVIGYHDDKPGVVASEMAPVIVFANHTCNQRLVHASFSAIQNVLPFVSSSSYQRNIYWLYWATNGIVSLNDYKGHWPELMAKKIIVPNDSICEQFGKFVAPLFVSISKLEFANDKIRQIRNLLLVPLISGELQIASSSETVQVAAE